MYVNKISHIQGPPRILFGLHDLGYHEIINAATAMRPHIVTAGAISNTTKKTQQHDVKLARKFQIPNAMFERYFSSVRAATRTEG